MIDPAPGRPLPVTVVLLARNEEGLIRDCLSAVRRWADELVVVDMESDDSTAAIATELGAKVIPHPLIGNFDLARTPGILAAKNDWILILDADETPTPALLDTLSGFVAGLEAGDALYLPRANLELSGFSPRVARFPEMMFRMFRKSKVDVEGYGGKIHSTYRPLPGARSRNIHGEFPRHCLLHFSNPALVSHWEKINLYTSEEARSRSAGRDFRLRPWHLLRPLRIFLRRWVLQGAWMEGWRGFWLCWVSGVYETLVLAKQWEMTLHGGEIPDAAMARGKMRDFVEASGENLHRD